MKYILTAVLALSLSRLAGAQSRPPQLTASQQTQLLKIKEKYQRQSVKINQEIQDIQNRYQELQLEAQRLGTAEQSEIAAAIPQVNPEDYQVDLDSLSVRPVQKQQPQTPPVPVTAPQPAPATPPAK